MSTTTATTTTAANTTAANTTNTTTCATPKSGPSARSPLATALAIATTAAAASGLLGCATIFTGSSDDISFTANAPNVHMSLDGKAKGDLPQKLEVSRNFLGGQHFKVKLEADGYETQEFHLDRVFNGWAVLDITSPVTSGGIDLLTGSLMKFSPTEYHVQMVPAGKTVEVPTVSRSLTATRFALMNFRGLRRDLARGGGEYLSAFATLVGDGDGDVARAIEAASLRSGGYLAVSPDGETLLQRVNVVLAKSPALDAYRL